MKYANTVGELKKMLSQYSDDEIIHAEHIEDGPLSPVGLRMDGDRLYLYPPSSWALNHQEGGDNS